MTTIIQNLSRDARVPEEKCNPRCLRKLYMKTMDTIQMNAAMMVQMTYDHLLEQEQSTYGWERCEKPCVSFGTARWGASFHGLRLP